MSPESENTNKQPAPVGTAEPNSTPEESSHHDGGMELDSRAEGSGPSHSDEPASVPAESALAEPQATELVSADTEPGSETSAAASLDELIAQYAVPQEAPAQGQTITGRVIEITELGVVVDVGTKSEGMVPAQELVEFEGQLPFEPGQEIEVEPLGQEKDGYQLYSYIRARRRRAWQQIEQSYRKHLPLTGKVVDRIKGGLVVDVGIRAFLPASQVDLRPVRDLEAWKGEEIHCRVIKLNRKRGNVVVSRRIVLEEEQNQRRAQLLETLTEGSVVTGRVKNITDYGVFVDLGGLDGLLHITDLSWGRIAHPSEAVQVGDEIEVKVLKLDREKLRLSLGRKQLLPDPWADVPERYPVGARVRGRVLGVTDYGAFVELEPGVEGLIHVSEMSWSKRVKHPSKIVSVGDTVEVVVLDVKPEQRRISLGLKQTMPDPWQSLAEKYPVGSTVSGRVRNLTAFGAFIEIEEGIDGLIHISDLSWTQKVKHPSEVVKKGETVQAKVLKIDTENRRLSLGLKQLDDAWAGWFEQHKVNDIVRGKVSRATKFGVFVELADGIEGLCHVSEIEGRRGKKGDRPVIHDENHLPGGLQLGQEYDFKIIKLNPDQHKIGLSYRAAVKQAERLEMQEYRSSRSSPTATIGDAILSKREMSS
jgi:small subunit ribosomal protein S1